MRQANPKIKVIGPHRIRRCLRVGAVPRDVFAVNSMFPLLSHVCIKFACLCRVSWTSKCCTLRFVNAPKPKVSP